MSAAAPSVTDAGSDRLLRRRRRRDRFMTGAMVVALALALVPLVLIVADVVRQGVGSLSLSFFSEPEPFVQTASGGGFGNGIRGTIKIVFLATLLAVPIGVLTAVYLVEFGRSSPFATAVRFFTDVMTGIPSIFVGIFVYTAVVLVTGSFSTWAGGIALALLMLPIVVRSAEEILRLVPDELREASYALGVPRWRTVLRIVIPTGLPGLTTGVLLAVARAAGETAPLLLTAFGSQLLVSWSSWNGPESTLTYQIFRSSSSPFPAQQDRAWTGALVLLLGVLAISVAAQTAARRGRRG